MIQHTHETIDDVHRNALALSNAHLAQCKFRGQVFRRMDAMEAEGKKVDGATVLVPNATIYHNFMHLELWEKAKQARLIWQRWLIRHGVPQSRAKETGWAMLQT